LVRKNIELIAWIATIVTAAATLILVTR